MDSPNPAIERRDFPGIDAFALKKQTSVWMSWRAFALWSGLALIGQFSSLQMIDAGRLIHFQHYRLLPQLVEQHFVVLVLLALQIVLVMAGIAMRAGQIGRWLKDNLGVWRTTLIGIFLALSGTALTPRISVYVNSLVFAGVIQFVSLANIVLVAWSIPEGSVTWLNQKFDSLVLNSRPIRDTGISRFALFATIWVVVVSGALSYFVYEAHPHVPDETQYIFQANYFAAGQLTVKAPLVPEAFSMYMVPANEERWYSIFSPGWPAMLAVGVKLGVVWLVNPLLGGFCVVLAFLFFRELYSASFANCAVLLLSCSPWFIFMSMSFMSHVSMLACGLCAAVSLQQAFKIGRAKYVFASGLCIGVLSLIRPLDGAMVAFLLGVWTLFRFRPMKEKLRMGVALLVGTVATAAFILPYNKAVTGSATLLPIDVYYTKYFWPDVMALGFGANRGISWGLDAFPGHSPVEAVVNAALNTFLLNTELFGWATGSLVLAAFFLLSGGFRKKDLWAVAVIGVVVGGYGLYWYHGGPDFGARYWFLAIIPLIALTVRGLDTLAGKMRSEEAASSSGFTIRFAVAALCFLTLINYFPWRAFDKYYHYLEMQPGVLELARENNFGRSLVLIRGEEHPDYQSTWVYNKPNFDGDDPIFAHDISAEVEERLVKAYSDRPVWIVDGPSRTGRGYQVIRGPPPIGEARR